MVFIMKLSISEEIFSIYHRKRIATLSTWGVERNPGGLKGNNSVTSVIIIIIIIIIIITKF